MGVSLARRLRPAALLAIAAVVVAPTVAVAKPTNGPVNAPAARSDPAGLLKGQAIRGIAINSPGSDPRTSLSDLLQLRADGVNTVNIYIRWSVANEYSTALAPRASTPTPQALRTVTSLAHAAGLSVEWMPIVTLNNGRARLLLNPGDRTTWWAKYNAMIDRYAKLAQSDGVEVFCIGSELHGLQDDSAHWTALASRVRTVDHFTGLTTYMSTTGYQNVTWWSAVDLIGLSPYYSISSRNIPPVDQMVAVWDRNLMPVLKQLWSTYHRPVIFNEIGYPSELQAALQPATAWTSPARKPSQEAQANAYEALLVSAGKQTSWLRGIVWFFWGPVKATKDRTYSPHNKMAECVVARYWGSPSLTPIGTKAAPVCTATHLL